MRYLRFCLVALIFVIPLLAEADTNGRDYAVSFGTGGGNNLGLRKVLSESNSTLFYTEIGFGVSRDKTTSTSGGTTTTPNTNTQRYSVSLGTRFFLNHDKFSDFFLLAVTQSFSKYSRTGDMFSGTSYTRTTDAAIGYGFEYFLDTHLSLEASAGLLLSYLKMDDPRFSNTMKFASFPGVRTAVTYYW